LQEIFKDQLKVLPVTYEPAERVRSFLKLTRFVGLIAIKKQFYTVVEDSILTQLFPKTSSPHTVIIDPNGTVRAITKPEYVDSIFISNLINNPSVETEGVKLFSLKGTSLYGLNVPTDQIDGFFYSGISNVLDGLTTKYDLEIDSNQGYVREFIGSKTLLELYAIAEDGYKPWKNYPLLTYRRLLVTEDPESWVYNDGSGKNINDKHSWDKFNRYNYESKIPLKKDHGKTRRVLLKKNLDIFFGTNGFVETLNVPCLCLIADENFPKELVLKRSSEKQVVIDGWIPNRLKDKQRWVGKSESGALTYVRNLNFNELINVVRKICNEPLPMFIDKTTSDMSFDVDFTGAENSLEEIRLAFASSGYQLILESHPIELFVLQEDSNPKQAISNVEIVFSPVGYIVRPEKSTGERIDKL